MNDLLVDSVVRQLGDRQMLQEVLQVGADAGFDGFTDDDELREFFERNQSEIVALCRTHADDRGLDVVSFVAGLGGLADDLEDDDEIGRALYGDLDWDDYRVAKTLAQFALDEAARFLCDRW